MLDQCTPPDGAISGLAWNPTHKVIWEATNSSTDTIYQVSPTCGFLGALAHPSPGYNGGGLELDYAGSLWMVSQESNSVYLVDSGLPTFENVPWLTENPTSGEVPIGGSVAIQVTVDASGMAKGLYRAVLMAQTNSGRAPYLLVPVGLKVGFTIPVYLPVVMR